MPFLAAVNPLVPRIQVERPGVAAGDLKMALAVPLENVTMLERQPLILLEGVALFEPPLLRGFGLAPFVCLHVPVEPAERVFIRVFVVGFTVHRLPPPMRGLIPGNDGTASRRTRLAGLPTP